MMSRTGQGQVRSQQRSEKPLRMTPSTLTIAEAETRLSALVKEAQLRQQSVLLTAEVTAEPLALLTPFLSTELDQQDAIARHLEIAEIILQLWQETPSNPEISASYATMLQSQLRLLAETAHPAPGVFAALVMLLRLALRQVECPITPAQLQVFAQGLTFLRMTNPTTAHLVMVDDALLAVGIDSRVEFGDPTLLQSYVDAD
jgi:hypothetical protein